MQTYDNRKALAQFTRPANVLAYTDGQAIAANPATVLTFGSTPQQGLGGYVTRVFLRTSNSAHTAAVRLHLYEGIPSTITDRTAFALVNGTAEYFGYVDFTTFVTGGTGSAIAVSEGAFSKPLQFAAPNGVVYGLLESRAAFTPTSGQVFAALLYTEVSS